MRLRSKIAAIVIALAAAGVGVALGASPAMASPGTVTCTGNQDQTFTPGLTFATQTIAFSADSTLDNCVSTYGDGITSGSFHIEGGGPGSCTVASFYSELTLHWNTGETSTIGLNTPADLKPLGQTVAVSYGQVLSGKYAGATVNEVLELTPSGLTLLQCLTTGIQDSSGILTLTIASTT